MLLTVPNTFANGTGEANKIDAVQMNANFDAIETVLNGNIEKNNVKTGSAICLNDTAMTISGSWAFNSFPTVPNASIPDAKLSANVPLKNATNTFSVKQTFGAKIDMDQTEVEQIVIHKLATAPVSPVTGQIYYNTTDNKFYGWNGTGWNQVDYIGGYTGGAIRSYSTFGTLDDGNGFKFWFKTEGASPTVKVTIKGEPFPQRFYTELGQHNHTFTGQAHTHSITDPGHYHTTTMGSHGHGSTQYTLSTHTHGVSTTSGGQSQNHTHQISQEDLNHRHFNVTPGANYTDYWQPGSNIVSQGVSLGHTHSVSTTTGVPSAYQSISSANLGDKNSNTKTTGISNQNATQGGTIGNKGVDGGTLSTVQKLYAKSLTVKIDGTNVTSNVLSATGWSAIGDGESTHAFHTTGTGEMDASSWKSYSIGFHTLEILEPESGFGCNVMIHIETT